jgi:uncharacterized protein YaiE (UPF0345 family)
MGQFSLFRLQEYVMLKVNAYFDDQVLSIAYQGESLATTVGVMEAGDYTFSTSQYERMTIIDGELWAKLPGQDEFKPYTHGDQFEVVANASFDVKVMRATAYLCTYE